METTVYVYMLTANEARENSERFLDARRLIDTGIKAAIFEGKFNTTIEVGIEIAGAVFDILGSLGYKWDTEWTDHASITIKW